MKRTANIRPDYTGIAAAAITQRRFIEKVDANTFKQATATAGVRIVGVSRHGHSANEPASIDPMGAVVEIDAGTSLTRSNDAHWDLTTDSSGRAVPWTASTGLPKLARWVPGTSDAVANQPITVELAPPTYALYGAIEGTVTIPDGSASADAALPVAVDGATRVTLIPQRADATLGQVFPSWPSADGTLRISGAANATDDTIVRYIVEAT